MRTTRSRPLWRAPGRSGCPSSAPWPAGRQGRVPTAIQTPLARMTTRKPSRIIASSGRGMVPNMAQTPPPDAMRSISSSGVRGGLLLVGRPAATENDCELIDDRDPQDGEPADEAKLRNPERNGDDALRHVVEAPGIVGQSSGLPGEIADEGGGNRKRQDLRDPLGRPFSRSSSSPTRIISPRLNVCASPRKAIATSDQAVKSSPDAMFKLISRPTDSAIISAKMRTRNPPAAKPAKR